VGKSVSHFIFDRLGEVVFTAFFGAGVPNLVIKLNFLGKTIIERFESIPVAASRRFGAIKDSAQNGLGIIVPTGCIPCPADFCFARGQTSNPMRPWQ